MPAVCLTLAASDEPGLEEVLAGLFVSWSLGPAGVSLWVPEGDADEVVERLASAGVPVLGRVVEPERDWLAESRGTAPAWRSASRPRSTTCGRPGTT